MAARLKMIIALCAVVLVAAGVGGYLYLNPSANYTGPVERITIAVSEGLVEAPIFIGSQEGIFSKYGLEVSFKMTRSGKQSLDAVFAGEADIAAVSEIPVMFNSFKRDDFSVISVFTRTSSDVQIVTRKDTGILSKKDLKGSKVGTFAGSSAEFFLDSLLVLENIPRAEVEVVDINPGDLPAALASGEVDAIAIWATQVNNAVNLLQDDSVVIKAPEAYTLNFSLVAMNDYIASNQEIPKRLIRAIGAATEFIRGSEEISRKFLVDRFGFDAGLVNSQWAGLEFGLNLDQSLILTLESEARWAIENNLTDATEIPNYLNYVDSGPLEAVNPSRVTIIR
ncbi:MAG: NrtA/SsuA/CpmA family ABC transporter substrate-binding protein [Chloroflexi bacterium]|nr:NrtA/SsuA/CpmA family ABC transporter substrate-binding protein [Chloroflexota bacterium]